MTERHVPRALVGRYSHSAVNEPILLHQGSIRVRQDNDIDEGNGTVSLEWLPRPSIEFHIERPLAPSVALNRFLRGEFISDCSIEDLGPLDDRFRVRAGASSNSFSGRIASHEQGTGQDITRLLFHLPNFIDYHGKAISAESTAGGRVA